MPGMMEVNVPAKKKGGKGGLFGKIFGGLAGALAAPFTGGASLAAVPVLMGAGSMIGGLVGSAVDPGKVVAPSGVSPLEVGTRDDPEVQHAQVTDALKAARTLPEDQQVETVPTLQQTQDALMKRIAAIKGPGRA